MHDNRPVRTRVLLVDDHSIVRMGLRQLFSAQPDFEVVGDVGSLREAKDAIVTLAPDLVVLDLGLGDEFALGALPRLREKAPPAARIVVLSSHAEEMYAERVLRAGANAYLMKSGSTEELLAVARRVMAGHTVVSAAQQSRMLERMVGRESAASAATALSVRELEVLRFIAGGRSTAEIAEILHRSVKTIESHKQALKSKLGAQTPAQLMRFAISRFENTTP
jgi:DNA-binding NarL/FixJ family response regulator